MKEGNKVNIRVFQREDIEKYAKLTFGICEAEKNFIGMLKKISGIYQQFEKDGFLSKSEGKLLIVSKEDEVLGYCSFFKGSPYVNGYEIGYRIFKEGHRGCGYGTEAVLLLIRFLFEYQPILRLQICMSEENVYSERVAIKAGFTYEGTMRSVFKIKGNPVNNKMYSITRAEWVEKVSLEPFVKT